MIFQKVQLGWNVHIDQGGWSFWLKAWGMKKHKLILIKTFD
jgi:hypothetical protein